MRALQSLDANAIVPAPVSVTIGSGAPFAITAKTTIVVPSNDSAAAWIGRRLATIMRASTDFHLPVDTSDATAPLGAIAFRLGGPQSLGAEGYELAIARDSVVVRAARPAGLFYGMQTLRQLLPAAIE